MSGIYEEVPLVELQRLERLDPVASAELGCDVVYAVQTGRDLIEQDDCGCLDDYTAGPITRCEAALWAYLVLIPMLTFASLLTLTIAWLT